MIDAEKNKSILENSLPPKTCKDKIQNDRIKDARRYKKDECGKCGSKNDLYLHHSIPISWGGGFISENCITLCKKCHLEAHNKLRKKLTLEFRHEILSRHADEITAFVNG
jgi:5-methylcytosine-specific restriction endonuclease McrA